MTVSQPRILCTRPLDISLIGQAADRGIIIDCLSFIETQASVNEDTRGLIERLAAEPIVAVFTSMNAVEAVAAAAGASEKGDIGQTGSRFAGWKIFCTETATRKLAGEHFGEERIAGTAGSAGALVTVILEKFFSRDGKSQADSCEPGLYRPGPGEPGPCEVFFFCGDQRREELPEQLRAAGVPVNEIVVYRTLPTPHKLDRPYEAVIFFSPSAVHSFFSENSLAAGAVSFAIGNTTAEAIRSYTGNELIVSGSPDKEAIVLQAIGYFQTKIFNTDHTKPEP